MTKWFQKKSQDFKRKNILSKYKNLCTSVFHFIMAFVLEGFLIIPQKKAPTSNFFSSQHVENGREKAMQYVYTVSGIHTF